MKGTLTKTEQGWVVTYGTSFLPLHPKNFYSVVNGMNGMGVEFEIVTETYDDGKGCTYAKIINNDVDKISDEEQEWMDAPMGHIQSVEDDVEKLAEQEFPYLIDSNIDNHQNHHTNTLRHGFKKGYNKAKETLYTDEQVWEAIDMARDGIFGFKYTTKEIIQSLKQPKQ
jgi:hypothetical protein